MTTALLLCGEDLGAWSAAASMGPRPGGELPYGMQRLRPRFDVVWSDAPHRGAWRLRPIRAVGGAARRIAPGTQGAVIAGTALIRRPSADVALSVFENSGLGFARLRRLLPRGSRTPHVMVSCWLAEDCLQWTGGRLRSVGRSMRGVDVVTVFSANQRDILGRTLGIPDDRIVVVPFGVDVGFFDARTTPGPPGGGGLVAVGSDSRRDYGTLFEALRVTRMPATVLCAARNLEGLTVPPGVTVRHGVYDADYRQLLHSADLVVTPTVAPAYPSGQTVVLEAMAMGRATLTTDSPAMRDYVVDDVTGVLTPPRDALGMARRIADLLADDARRASIGSAAASAVRGSFTLDHMWDAIGRVMAGLVD